MPMFRKKPVVIDAWQMTDQAVTPDWISAAISAGRIIVSDTEVLPNPLRATRTRCEQKN